MPQFDITNESDPEKPDLLFRMAELYAEQTRCFCVGEKTFT